MKDEKRERLYARYMKMFASTYEFSLCGRGEIKEVADFIDTYWKQGHALVKSKELMDWQHYDPASGTYHFAIARSRETGEIHAIEGFIPTSQFDPGITTPMTWGAIWKTREDVAPAGLGVVVKQFREHECPSAYAMEVGISADASKYNKRLGNSIFELEPWYMANLTIKDYRLFVPGTGAGSTAAGISQNAGRAMESNGSELSVSPAAVGFRQVKAQDWKSLQDAFAPGAIPPFKSHTYYYNRYFAHPLYTYEALLLEDASTDICEAVFYRVVHAEGRRGIFIVDYIGDGSLLAAAGRALAGLLSDKDAEYILFLCSGIEEAILLSAGFRDRRKDASVVPVYYEPFLRRNVDILCTSHGERLTWPAFKGDADQDRPSVLT